MKRCFACDASTLPCPRCFPSDITAIFDGIPFPDDPPRYSAEDLDAIAAVRAFESATRRRRERR